MSLAKLFCYPFARCGFRRAEAGNVAIIFSLSLMVLMGGAGAAIDYVRMSQQKTVLTAASDAAVLAAVASAIEAEKSGATGIQKLAKTAALNAWTANLASAGIKFENEPKIIVKKSGTAWDAEVSYDGSVQTTFMGLLGINSLPLKGDAKAGTTIEKVVTYWDMHIVVDDSSSMGIGATQADMDALTAHPSINCSFACHWADYSSGGQDSASIAKAAGIKLRIDIVDDAVDAMISDMKTASSSSNVRAKLWGLNDTVPTLVAMTTKLNEIANHDIQLYKTPVSVGNTNYRASFEKLEAEVGKAGDGKSAVDPKKAVFIVTDGIHDSKFKESNSAVDWYDHYTGPIDPAFCSKMKANGVIVGVLYIDYITPAGFDFAIDPYKDEILPNLKACASEDLFFNATTPANITAAMKTMLATAFGIGDVRLTD